MPDEPLSTSDETASESAELFRRNLEFLSEEIARLEQVVAALVLVLFDDGAFPETSEMYDWIASWAVQEFDLEALRESLGEHLAPLPGRKVRLASQAIERQRELFSQQVPDPHDGDKPCPHGPTRPTS